MRIRAVHADKNLAWLYNDSTMPEDLKIAHAANDAAVMSAYGYMTEAEIIPALMKKYLQLTK